MGKIQGGDVRQFVYLVRFSCDMGNLKCKSKSHSLLCNSVISIIGGGGRMQGKQQVKSNGKCCKVTQMSTNFSLKNWV